MEENGPHRWSIRDAEAFHTFPAPKRVDERALRVAPRSANHAEEGLCCRPCQMSLCVKALHIFKRHLHGGEPIADHVPFVGGEGLDRVYLSMGDRDKSAAKSRRITQGCVSPDSPKRRHRRIPMIGTAAEVRAARRGLSAGLITTTELMVAEKPKKETLPISGMPPGGSMDY
jgi:hypothetical protein